MVNKVEESILSIQRWKARAGLVSGSFGVGWDVATEARVGIDRPVTLYVCEPLQSGFAAFSVFEQIGFENLVKDGLENYGTADEMFAAVTSVTKALLANLANSSPELIDAVLTGNLIIHAGSKSGAQIVADQSCNQLGIIVYANPLVNDVAFRPMDLRNQVQVSEEIRTGNPNANFEKDRLVLTLKDYVLHDEPLLPEYFEGANVLGCSVQIRR